MIEASGKAATEVVKGLSGSPMLLALLVLNAIMVGSAVYYLHAASTRNVALFEKVLTSCLPGGGK